jgi:hypothetical protein
MTPNLVESIVIWQGLSLITRDWSGKRLLKREPDQDIKSLENFDRV